MDPVDVVVPRDRDGSFEPRIVAKRQRRLSGVDEMVISLSAKGLTTGEIQAHLAEVYGAEVSRQSISTITDAVIAGMAERQNRPLNKVYPVLFIDAIQVKIREGKVANRPIYVALAVWPQAVVQTCVVHSLRNSFRYAGRQHWDAIAKALRPVYTAPTEAAGHREQLDPDSVDYYLAPLLPYLQRAPIPPSFTPVHG